MRCFNLLNGDVTIVFNFLLKLIGRYLRAGIMVNGKLNPSLESVPQGGPLSPLLSSIMLDSLDRELEKHNHRFTEKHQMAQENRT